jgi:hypothetical protein
LLLVDAPLPDAIEVDSSDHLGDIFPAVGYLRREKLGSLYNLTLASYKHPDIADSQLRVLANAILDEFRGDLTLARAYVSRFRGYAQNGERIDRLRQLDAQLCAAAQPKYGVNETNCTPDELESRWKRRKASLDCEFPPDILRRYKRIEIQSLKRSQAKL